MVGKKQRRDAHQAASPLSVIDEAVYPHGITE